MHDDSKRLRLQTLAILALLVLLPLAAAAYKVLVLDYSLAGVLPQTEYTVRLDMKLDGADRRVRVSTFAPQNDERQTISEVTQSAPESLLYSSERDGLNRLVRWRGGARIVEHLGVAHPHGYWLRWA